MAGNARLSGPDRAAPGTRFSGLPLVALLAALIGSDVADAQELYKYQGRNGEWIYSDLPPQDGRSAEVRELARANDEAALDVWHRLNDGSMELVARNDFYAPVEIRLEFSAITGLSYPDPDATLTWVLPPRSSYRLLELEILDEEPAPHLEYQFRYLPGDPAARHRPIQPYRAPFALSNNYPVTQAYPELMTHTGPDSFHAVDVAMPIGTDIFAAREGVVFDVSGRNYRSGLDVELDGPAANVVRVLHDDGTYAIYAHLNTNTIRVKPGDRVVRGQYIADSGNTGFSSGPHLHFAVVRNAGLRLESVPITFLGANSSDVVPATGTLLTAY